MNESSRRLVVASYFIALLFVLGPIADSLTNVFPWQVSSEQWRFGLVGVTSNYLVSVVFGLLLAAFTAAAAEHRVMLRVIAITSVTGAAVLLLVCVAYVLDTVQLRPVVREEQVPFFRIGAVKSILKVLTSVVALVLLGIGCFKGARSPTRSR